MRSRHQKAEWAQALFTCAHADGAVAVVWCEVDKETDWRITSDPQTTRVVSGLLTDSRWLIGA